MPTITKEQLQAIIRDLHPPSIISLKNYLKSVNLECSDEELVELIGKLSSEGVIGLYQLRGHSSFSRFFGDFSRSWWVYAILILTIVEMLLVVYGSSGPFFTLLRQVLGVALLGFLPGYSSLKALFPRDDLALLERIVLSIFLSLVVSIFVGTILGSFLSFVATTNVIVLTEFTVLVTLAAGYRSSLVSKVN